eukprot:14810_1
MDPKPLPSSLRQPLPQGMQTKLKSVLSEISTSSTKIKSKLTHVNPIVKTAMPPKLEEALCSKFKHFPITHDYICPRFDVDDPAAYKHLETQGYVVIKDIVPTNEIKEVKDMVWDWLEQLPFPNDIKINRNNPESWHDGNWPTDPDTGIIFSFGVGQTEFMWRCRSYPGVKKAFSNVWGTSDLITSFDGMNLYRPWKYYAPWRTKGKWWHLDQNGRREDSKGKASIQGILALTDGDDTTGGLCVIPKTHFDHDEICERVHWPKHSDYLPIPRKDKMFDDFRSVGGYLVHYKAGDLVLWDGRTVHCNCPSNEAELNPETGQEWCTEKEKKEKEWDVMRMIMYICMGPTWQAKNEILKKRQEIA